MLQRGVTLVVSLLLLLVVSIVALSSLRYSTQALQVAVNSELRANAFQNAESIVEATITNAGNTPVVLGTAAGTVVTCSSSSIAGCSSAGTITMPNSFLASEVSASPPTVKVKVTALGIQSPPPGMGYEIDSFQAAQFAVDAVYDHTASGDGRGQSQVNAGIIRVFPK
jgi:Tfp pilus assembly protein PilX